MLNAITNTMYGNQPSLSQIALSTLRRDGNYLFSAAKSDTLFSNTTGTTAAVLDGTVAGWLDWATVAGAEKVTNGRFDTDTDWTKHANTTISGGVASTTGITSFATMIAQNISFVANKTYKYTITTTKVSGSNISLSVGAQTVASGVGVTGTYTGYFTSAASGLLITYVWENSGGTWVGSIDNISVTEVGPLLTQATAGYQPRLRYADGIWYIDFDGTDDLLTLPAMSGVSAATLIYSVKDLGHLTHTGQDLTSAKTINTDNLCGLIVCRTAPSAADLTLLERYADSLAGGVQTLGPELVTNGGFDSDAVWTQSVPGSWDISSGTARHNTAFGGSNINQAVLIVGRLYKLSFNIVSISIGGLTPYIGIGRSFSAINAPGYYEYIGVCAGNGTMYLDAGANGDVTIDNVSVREVTFA